MITQSKILRLIKPCRTSHDFYAAAKAIMALIKEDRELETGKRMLRQLPDFVSENDALEEKLGREIGEMSDEEFERIHEQDKPF